MAQTARGKPHGSGPEGGGPGSAESERRGFGLPSPHGGGRRLHSVGFRFHDLRHQAITEMAEAGASDATLMALAGHMSRRMLEHYSHVRMAAKRTALDKLEGGLMAIPQATSLPETGAVH